MKRLLLLLLLLLLLPFIIVLVKGRVLKRHIRPEAWEGRKRSATSVLRETPRRDLVENDFDNERGAALLDTTVAGALNDVPILGESRCRCASVSSLAPIRSNELSSFSAWNLQSKNLSTYGIGCKNHDEDTLYCSTPCEHCDKVSCPKTWCWVDPATCGMLNHKSIEWREIEDRYYSYATCRNSNFPNQEERIEALYGTTIRAGFNTNSGGWKGAYNKHGYQFKGPLEDWGGPMVAFFEAAAREANFTIALTEPPPFLSRPARAFFNTQSDFDLCVYATALGFLDICIAQFTVTTERASSSDFYVVEEPGLYLVLEVPVLPPPLSYEGIVRATRLVYQPFSTRTWILLVFCVIPLMGILMVVHELGEPGSTFVREREFLQRTRSQTLVKRRRVPLYRHMVRAVYGSLLGVVQQSYDLPVVSYGAKLHLIGISFLILTIIAVYTANLAAILSGQALRGGKTLTVEDALKRNYRFCVERKTLPVIRTIYRMEDRFIVRDSSLWGGDGKLGIDSRRDLVLDRVNPALADKNETYCHAAITLKGDLEVLQSRGLHCNLRAVGKEAAKILTGFPVYEGPSRVNIELKTIFARLQNHNELFRQFNMWKPEPQCDHVRLETDAPTEALSISELTGVWFVAFGFASVALLVTFLKPIIKKRYHHTTDYHTFTGYDQYGQEIDKFQEAKIKQDLKEKWGDSTHHHSNTRDRRRKTDSPSATRSPSPDYTRDFEGMQLPPLAPEQSSLSQQLSPRSEWDDEPMTWNDESPGTEQRDSSKRRKKKKRRKSSKRSSEKATQLF